MGNQQYVTPYNTWDLSTYSRMTGLTPLQIQELYTAFEQQSAVTGGRMTITEFKNVYASIAGLTWNFDAEAERVFLTFDTNSTGTLSFNEFLMAYLMLQRSTNPAERWSYLANNYGVSQPGYVSAPEAQLLYNNMQQFYNVPVQENYFNTAWSQVTPNASGYVPATSFVQAVVPLLPESHVW